MTRRMPIEASRRLRVLRWVRSVPVGKNIEQGQELPFDHVVAPFVPAALVRKHKIVGLLALRPKLPFLEHESEWLGKRKGPHSSGGLGDVLIAIGVDPRLDSHFAFCKIDVFSVECVTLVGPDASCSAQRELAPKIVDGRRRNHPIFEGAPSVFPCCVHVAWSFRQIFATIENAWKFMRHYAAQKRGFC